MGTDRLEQFGSDTAHPVEALQGPERTALIAIRDDPCREGGTDAREARQLCGLRPIEVDALSRSQRASQGGGTVCHLGTCGRVDWATQAELHVARRARTRREHEPGSNTERRQDGEEKGGTSIFAGHDPSDGAEPQHTAWPRRTANRNAARPTATVPWRRRR